MKFKAIATALLGAASALTVSADAPKYIFFFIGDGMGMGEIMNAQVYNRVVLENETPLTMMQFPVASFCTTHSASSDVTDSAAAGTALATGHKTKNGMLGMNPDTLAVTSIAKVLHDNGYGVGLITSVAIDDATPGAFYAHVPNRGMFREIGVQLAESGYEFAAGAGLRGTKDKAGNDNGLLKVFEDNDMKISYGLDGYDATADRMLILSPDTDRNWNIGYTVDSIPGALTLPSLTRTGLDHMMRVAPDKFFMMVEGGNIDHAGHANDGGTNIKEVLNFDESLAIAYDFYRQHPDETLIVVTADHETGGMSVGCQATGYSAPVVNIRDQKISKEMFAEHCKAMLKSRRTYKWDDMHELLADKLGFWKSVELTDAETAELRDMFTDIFENRNSMPDQKTLYASFDAFSARVFNILNNKAGIGWTTGSHTGAPVPVFAVGVDADKFSEMTDNTTLPRKIIAIAGHNID